MRYAALVVSLCLVVGMAGAAQISFVVVLEKQENTVTMQDISLVNGPPPERQDAEALYTARVIGYNGSVLSERRFSFPTLVHSANASWFNEDGEQIYEPPAVSHQEARRAVLVLPYHRAAAHISIVDAAGDRLLQIDTGDFAVCNLNSRCDASETAGNCPEDCGSTGTNIFLWLIPVLLVLIAVVVGYFSLVPTEGVR